MHPAPIEPFQERLKLGGAQPHHPVMYRRPTELSILEPLGDQHHTAAVPEDQLHPVSPLRAEDVDHARERIGVHRLAHQRRNVAVHGEERDVGAFLWQQALAGGAQAAGRRLGVLAQGRRADLLVLDSAHPNLDGVPPQEVLGRFLFCGNDNLVRDVLAGGHWVVQGGRHKAQDAIAQRYKAATRTLHAH